VKAHSPIVTEINTRICKQWCTFSCACISLALRRAITWIWLDTCFRERIFPVRSLMYRAISSLRPTSHATLNYGHTQLPDTSLQHSSQLLL